MRGQRGRSDTGAAAVEFALVLPLLVVLLFGMISTGLMYSDHLSVTNAVREASRYGSAVDYTSSGWAASVHDRVKELYFGAGKDGGKLADKYDSYICVDLVNAAGTSLASSMPAGNHCGNEPDSPADMATGTCVVKVWMTKPAKIELIVAPSLNFNVGAKSVSYYGRTVAPGCTATS